MNLEIFNRTLDTWIKALAEYDFHQLCSKPSPASWSLGQLYKHLILETRYYVTQMKICVAGNDHAREEASPNAIAMFLQNEFPDEALEGSPENAFISQPENKEQLTRDLFRLKEEVNKVAVLISESTFAGKTKHPGLNYFSAQEWLQFADMHLRHHFRQKKRIDAFLKLVSPGK